jgi:hypothetical protein
MLVFAGYGGTLGKVCRGAITPNFSKSEEQKKENLYGM